MITIYWSINTQVIPEGLRVLPPVPIKNKLFEDRIRSKSYGQELLYDKCPALDNELTNLYGMKSVYDYNLEIDDQGKTEYSSGDDHGAVSPDDAFQKTANEDFFNQHIMVRSLAGRLFSFIQGLVFFTDARSLIMSQLPAFMEDNSVMKNTILIPGQFDIGKYFRPLDMAWHFRDGCNRIEFSREEISFYLKFHTKEKIKFQRFLFTDELVDLSGAMFRTKGQDGHSSKFKYDALKYYYNIFDKYNFKNKMLKIIKENLCKEEDLEGEVVK
jgi:hypothetical protein